MISNVYHFKDSILAELAKTLNVAQFVSFSPTGDMRHSLVSGFEPDHQFSTPKDAMIAILMSSSEGKVNIRSFDPIDPKSKDFIYGIDNLSDLLEAWSNIAKKGFYTIINETVDINDGGVSGVAFGDVVEFSPRDTPRCVEKSGCASLPKDWADYLFKMIYGIDCRFSDIHNKFRVEFSLHPLKRGYLNQHIIIWEFEEFETGPTYETISSWPNNFSQEIGDKTYGLLMAFIAGSSVPLSTVMSRSLAPFVFGEDTGETECWLRTAPNNQTPGKYTTHRGWVDPFHLMQNEDQTGENIAAIISQKSVPAKYSGACVTRENDCVIEGVEGWGDNFMSGISPPISLPDHIIKLVQEEQRHLASFFGPVRFEWCVDQDDQLWILQLHVGSQSGVDKEIFPGEVSEYIDFKTSRGLEELREFLETLDDDIGINLLGNVGITSHFGDVLRKAKRPSKLSQLPPG